MKSFSIGALIAAAAALGISIFCTFTLDNALSWTDRVNPHLRSGVSRRVLTRTTLLLERFRDLPLRPLAAHCSVWWEASCSSSRKSHDLSP